MNHQQPAPQLGLPAQAQPASKFSKGPEFCYISQVVEAYTSEGCKYLSLAVGDWILIKRPRQQWNSGYEMYHHGYKRAKMNAETAVLSNKNIQSTKLKLYVYKGGGWLPTKCIGEIDSCGPCQSIEVGR